MLTLNFNLMAMLQGRLSLSGAGQKSKQLTFKSNICSNFTIRT